MIDRDRNGRFANGNAGGPGRPPRLVEADYLATMADQVSMEAWKGIVRRALEDATRGDRHARDWLSRYLLGDRPMIGVTLREARTRPTPEERAARLAMIAAKVGIANDVDIDGCNDTLVDDESGIGDKN